MLAPIFCFSEVEIAACKRLIALALDEDLGQNSRPGDVTSQAVIPADLRGQAAFVSRSAGVLSGLHAARLVLHAVSSDLHLETFREDGDELRPHDRIAVVTGPMRGILAAERTALNVLQHLSGIASLTRQYVDAVAGLNCEILDTRKTLPGWRLLAKYAVRCGGGHNHRLGLHDGILIKDNHLAALASHDLAAQGAAPSMEVLQSAVRAARAAFPGMPVEIEVDELRQFDAALACRPDIILLDNMRPNQLRQAVSRRNAVVTDTDYVFLEASGGVDLQSVRPIAETGVDRISIGALTHSAPALDIALDYEFRP
jgi:nicotinate-nucleotide pyrophosphorylase (carboxylating)